MDFNPRSHERSDADLALGFMELTDFNPRSHERSDMKPMRDRYENSNISIHAPTRGATMVNKKI